MRGRVPSAPAVFVGREAELARLTGGLARVAVALVVGVAGVGKSGLAYAFAARRGGQSLHRKLRREPLGALLDDLRRLTAGGPVPELRSDAERLEDLAYRLDEGDCLLVLDDLERLAGDDRAALVAGLAVALRRGRAIVTSRELVPVRPGDADRIDVHLAGLGEAGSRALWEALDELYGPSGSYEVAEAHARGNPFLLRRAHAGHLEGDDPMQRTVLDLGPQELHLACLLALAEVRAPLAALEPVIPGVRTAARRLVAVLVADMDGAGTCGLTSAFLPFVLGALPAAERPALHRELAAMTPMLGLDPVTEIYEAARHLVAAGDLDAAGVLLVSRGADLVRLGATAVLLRAVDLIPPERRTPPVQLARARALVRLLEARAAVQELVRLADAGVEPRHEIQYSLATTSFMIGQLADGRRRLETLLADPSLPGDLRRGVLTQLAWSLTSLGRGAEGRTLLREAASKTTGSEASLLHFYRGVSAWADEEDAEMREAMTSCLDLVPADGPPYATGNLIPASLAAMLARAGRREEAERLLDLARSGWARADDLSSQTYLTRMRGVVAWELGERAEALELLRAAATAYQRTGHVMSALSVEALVGRALLTSGRRAEGRSVLAATRSAAEGVGLLGPCRAAERALSHDVESQLDADPPPTAPPATKRGELVRHRTLAALRAAAAGRGDVMRGALDGLEVDGPGYGLDRALGHVARALLARVEGKPRDVTRALEQARAEAAADGVDADVAPGVFERLGGPVLVTSAKREVPAARGGALRYDVVLDGVKHELRVKNEALSLAHRPALRKLLYALAARPNLVVTKEDLANQLWAGRYNPLRHDGALWVNVRRLRVLLEKTGLTIELAEDGYRLAVPASFVYVDAG